MERHTASVTAVSLDYYTEPLRRTEIALLNELERGLAPGGEKGYGEIQVTSQVTGFTKRRWYTHEKLGEEPLDLPPSELQTTGYWLRLSEETVSHLREAGAWTNDPNDYGPDWPHIREAVVRGTITTARCAARRKIIASTMCITRPRSACSGSAAGSPTLRERANRLDNLTTLCPSCHRKAEQNVRMKSGLAGLGTLLSQLAPLFLMCDPGDLGLHIDPVVRRRSSGSDPVRRNPGRHRLQPEAV